MLTISIDSTFIKIYVNIFLSSISSSAATQAMAAAAAGAWDGRGGSRGQRAVRTEMARTEMAGPGANAREQGMQHGGCRGYEEGDYISLEVIVL